MCGLLLLTAAVLWLEWLSVARRDTPYYFLRRPVMLGLLVVLILVLAPEKDNGFIYFAF